MAMLRDRRGFLWVGTEGAGLWRYDSTLPPEKAWTQFTVKDGLGDGFCYSLLEDFQGRIWVGHATAGVSVWNGAQFANYGPIENEDKSPKSLCGPLSERIFSMALRPANGEVWMSTGEGLCFYRPQTDSWHYRTRREGLPSNLVQSVAFDSFDTLYVGTQANGLAKSGSESDFTRFERIDGPSEMPSSVEGTGLPSNGINDLFVGEDDTIYAATKRGLARSHDLGNTWNFLRGVGWEKHVLGRARKTQPQSRPEGFNREVLREDYITNIAEADYGLLLFGFRARGYEVRRPIADHNLYISTPDDKPDLNYVSTVLAQPGGAPILGFYGDGVKIGAPMPGFVPNAKEREFLERFRGWKRENYPPLSNAIPRLPAGAKAPTTAEIDDLLKPLSALKTPFAVGSAIEESDDWRTKGDWVGRYGRQYAILCAMRAPLNHYVTLNPEYEVGGTLGTHFRGDDSLRHWVHWVKTDNANTLYNPVIGYRRQAEWDDHGEEYPFEFEGPDMWAKVKIPEGTHRLSLYFFNKDGIYGHNRARDYALEIRAGKGTDGKTIETAKDADGAPTLVRSRVRDFWNGVYKRFIVRGPSTYWVKFGRDGSYNTIVSSVMLDKIVGPRTQNETQLAYMGRYTFAAPDWAVMSYEGAPAAQSAIVAKARAWEWKIDAATTRDGGVPLTDGLRTLALRALMAQPKNTMPPQLLERWRWKSAHWNKRDRTFWNKAMAEGREAFFELNPHVRNVEW